MAYSFVPATDEDVFITVTDITQDLDFFVVSGAPPCDGSGCLISGYRTGYEFEQGMLSGGTLYHIMVDGFSGATSDFALTVSCLDPLVGAGTCASPYTIPITASGSYSVLVNTCGEGNDVTSSDCADTDGEDVVFELNLAAPATVTADAVEIDGSVFINTAVYVEDVCPPSTRRERQSDV